MEFSKCQEAFNEQFPNVEDAFDFLWEVYGDKGCRRGHFEYEPAHQNRYRICLVCGDRRSVTANTIFHKVKKVRERLNSIWLKVHGLNFNAFQLKDILKMAYGSVWASEHALRKVAADKLTDEAVAAQFAFAMIVGRRTIQTEAYNHPVAEVLEQLFQSTEEPSETIFGTQETEGEFYAEDAVEVPQRGEGAGVSAPNGPGNEQTDPHNVSGLDFVLMLDEDARDKPFQWLSKVNQMGTNATSSVEVKDGVGIIASLIAKTFQSVGAKYLQLYMAHVMFVTPKNRFSFKQFVVDCLNTEPFGADRVKAFSSPKRLKILPLRELVDCSPMPVAA